MFCNFVLFLIRLSPVLQYHPRDDHRSGGHFSLDKQGSKKEGSKIKVTILFTSYDLAQKPVSK
jgi:hypothetical protein